MNRMYERWVFSAERFENAWMARVGDQINEPIFGGLKTGD